jgi:Tfp pilus assembly protein PilV
MSRGITIIEVLVAIFVLIIGIVAILGLFPVSIQLANYSQQTSTALELSQEGIEEQNSKSYDEILIGTTTESALPAPFQNYSRQTEAYYVDANLNSTTSDTGLKKIKVKVSFKNPLNLQRNVSVTTLIVKK